jgi:NAD(P)-dependent dehydrogenase (short-subunit alcohol dehydrogenase family)
MTATTHSHFGANTEALEVAQAFPEAIKGKTVVIIGVNKNGIGFTTAQAFASQEPRVLIVAGRTKSKLEESIDWMKKDYPNVDYRALVLELGSQKAVRAAAEELLSWQDVPSVDLLVNSAGISGSVETRELNEDGIEMIFGRLRQSAFESQSIAFVVRKGLLILHAQQRTISATFFSVTSLCRS